MNGENVSMKPCNRLQDNRQKLRFIVHLDNKGDRLSPCLFMKWKNIIFVFVERASADSCALCCILYSCLLYTSHVNIVTNWNSTPAVLKPLDEVTGKFFVRIKNEAAEEAQKVFGDVEIISLGQLPQECAFITDEMTQGAVEEKLAQSGDQVLAKIRVKD